MAKLFNRAKMTTATTGSGTITLGSAANGFQSFADAGVSDGDVVQYVIEEGFAWEIGTGTYSASGTSLTRTPSESSNSGSAITLGGAAKVSITTVAADLNRLQNAGSDIVTVSASGAAVTGNITVTGTVDGRDIASDGATLDGLGTASTHDVGTAAGNVVELDSSARLPAVDGSQLTGIEGVPSGIIAMWSGTNATIPTGWNLCDGTNNTPDLRNRFIVGSGDTYSTDDTGGSDSVTLTTSQMPAHTHSGSGLSTNTAGAHHHTVSHNGNPNVSWGYQLTGSTNSVWVNVNTSTAGAHSHSITGNTGSAGSGSSHENRPPYYALAYIMKS